MQVDIRQMRLEDISQVVRVANQSFIEMARLTSRFGARAVEYLRDFPEWQVVAVADDRVVGFSCVVPAEEEKEARLQWIATHPDWWGKGVGGKLLKAIETKGQALGYERVALGTPFAKRFYEKYGYQPTGVEYRMVKEIMGRRVGPPSGVETRMIDLEHLPVLVHKLDEARSFDLALHFLETYEAEQDKAFVLQKGSEMQGIVIAKTDPYEFHLIQAIFIYYKKLEDLQDILGALEYLGSKKGKRWVGFSTDKPEVKSLAGAAGWEESRLPSFWTRYWLCKAL